MANERLPENPQPDPQRVYNMASLRLTQAVAMIRVIGAAVEYCPSQGLPIEDASGGVVHLLEEASGLFQSIHAPVPI
jgi:hypothetical protein